MAHAAAQQAASDDTAWDTYLQAPPEPFALYSEPGGGAPAAGADEHAAVQYSALAQDATVEPRALYTYDPSAFVAAAAYSHEPQRSYSTGTTPSPALPSLSPASSASASSSYLGLVSPYHQSTASDYLHGGLHHSAGASDGGLSVASPSSLKGSSRGVLDGQGQQHPSQRHQPHQSYQQDQLYQPPLSPAYTHSRPPPSFLAPPAPTTPRRQAAASSTHLYRSPSAYPATSSPATSPYHRPTPRSTASFPSAAASARRGSTSSINESPSRKATPRKIAAVTESVDANGSPTKSIRRVSTLSIDVPPPPPPSGRRGSLVGSMPPSSRPPLAMQPTFSSSQRSAPPSLSASQQLTEASVREVEQLLGELGPILDPSLYEHDAGGLSSSSTVPGGRLPVLDEGTSMFSPTSVSISGVTLGEDDFRLLDDAGLGLPDAYHAPTYPQSAPAWQTSFDLPPPPPPSSLSSRWNPHSASSAAQSYALAHSNSVGSLAPAFNPHVRAHSARDAQPSSSSHESAYPTSPSVAALRRRSSCHAFVGASQPPPSPHRHHAHPHSHQPPPWANSASTSSPSRQPYYPTYERQPLPAVLQPPPDVLRPVTPPPREQGGLSASVSRGSPMSPKTTPKRKRGSPTKPKQPVAMFVNYSAQDAKKLLNGVAPSGSTKKRREEEDAQRQRGDLSSSILLDDPASLPVLPLPFATGSRSSTF
ncbi:hypothetical protein JCM8208_002218 [Rhodotorula glutinis]